GMKGLARLETTFQGEPVNFESGLSYTAPLLRLTDVKGNAPGLSLTGGGIFSTENTLFDGTVSVSAKNIARYSDLAGFTLAGKLKADVALKPSNDNLQAADIAVSIEDGAFDTIKV